MKPQTLSLKDWLIRKLAVKLMLSEKTIETVINHQFTSAMKAMEKEETVEFSGFGKLIFNKKKAINKMTKMLSQREMFTSIMNDENRTEQIRKSAKNKLNNTNINIEILKPKVNEFFSNCGRMEKQTDSSISSEISN